MTDDAASEAPSDRQPLDPRALDPQALAEACAAALWAEDRASAGLGLELLSVGPGRARLAMRIRADMTNGHGTCHGGFIFALADSAFAFACNAHDRRAVAQHCAVTYLSPGRLGDRLVAEAVERVREGRSGVYDVAVRDEGGRAVAEFRGHSRTIGGTVLPGTDAPGDGNADAAAQAR